MKPSKKQAMVHYFVEKKGLQEGPLTFDELAEMRLLSGTRVWRTGMDGWDLAENIPELEPILIKRPPPLKKPKADVRADKYDNSYEGADAAQVTGVILILASIGFYVWGPTKDHVVILVFLAIRILLTIWVSAIAKEQNRARGGWTLSAFFFPAITLIIIGSLKKLKGTEQDQQAPTEDDIEMEWSRSKRKKVPKTPK